MFGGYLNVFDAQMDENRKCLPSQVKADKEALKNRDPSALSNKCRWVFANPASDEIYQAGKKHPELHMLIDEEYGAVSVCDGHYLSVGGHTETS